MSEGGINRILWIALFKKLAVKNINGYTHIKSLNVAIKKSSESLYLKKSKRNDMNYIYYMCEVWYVY
jgi:hypothetical protein